MRGAALLDKLVQWHKLLGILEDEGVDSKGLVGRRVGCGRLYPRDRGRGLGQD